MDKKEIFGEPNWKKHGFESREQVMDIIKKVQAGETEEIKPPKKRGRPKKTE